MMAKFAAAVGLALVVGLLGPEAHGFAQQKWSAMFAAEVLALAAAQGLAQFPPDPAKNVYLIARANGIHGVMEINIDGDEAAVVITRPYEPVVIPVSLTIRASAIAKAPPAVGLFATIVSVW